MRSYNYDSIVSKAETEALKEMIFKRARERAESLNKETQDSYTSNVQNDIMEIAHNSFAASKNPFAPKTTEEQTKHSLTNNNIGFSERKVNEIKEKITVYKKQKENNEVSNNMEEARESLENKKTFVGALNFLNSQASISLVNKRKKGFEAIA